MATTIHGSDRIQDHLSSDKKKATKTITIFLFVAILLLLLLLVVVLIYRIFYSFQNETKPNQTTMIQNNNIIIILSKRNSKEKRKKNWIKNHKHLRGACVHQFRFNSHHITSHHYYYYCLMVLLSHGCMHTAHITIFNNKMIQIFNSILFFFLP